MNITWLSWLIIAIVFLIIEILTPGIFLFSCFSIGAVVAMILSFFISSSILQCIIFALVSIISIYLLRPLLVKLVTSVGIVSNVNNLVNKVGIVIEKIEGNRTMGLVKVDNELWRAISVNNEVIEKDKEVIVVKVEGVHLVVKQK